MSFSLKGTIYMKAKSISFPFLIVFLLCSCNVISKAEPANADSVECIPPLTTFSFPLRTHSETIMPDQAPRSPWQEVKAAPADNFATIPFLARQAKNGGNEIWFVSDWGIIEHGRIKTAVKYVLIYHTATNEWEKIDNFFEGGEAQIFGVYELSTGELIADGFSKTEHVFGVFDEEKRIFVENTALIDVPDGPLLFDEKRQLFWVFVEKDGIYNVDPVSNEIKFWISLPNLDGSTMKTFSNVRIDDKGDIYLLYNTDMYANRLFRFVPDTLEFEYVYNPLGDYYSNPPNSIFITKSGQLWLNDLGWRDTDGIWHLTVQSPVFISNRFEDNGYTYGWYYGTPLYESSNSYLWFNSVNGVVFLDQKQEKWCWVTTDNTSSMIEDEDKTLWMIVYGKLYKLEMK